MKMSNRMSAYVVQQMALSKLTRDSVKGMYSTLLLYDGERRGPKKMQTLPTMSDRSSWVWAPRTKTSSTASILTRLGLGE
jgi:hypothetical protein